MLVKFEQIVWSKPHEILSFLTKNRVFYNHFWQRFDPFWKKFLYLKLLINDKLLIYRLYFCQCDKNYGTPTLVTRLKVAPNMAVPISPNKNLP